MELVSNQKDPVPVPPELIWALIMLATIMLPNVLKPLYSAEFVLNVSPISTSFTLENVFLKLTVLKDNTSSTTSALMSALPVETSTDKLESASTVSVPNSNSIMACAFLNPLVELDNGLIIMENVKQLTLYARPSTLQMVFVLVV